MRMRTTLCLTVGMYLLALVCCGCRDKGKGSTEPGTSELSAPMLQLEIVTVQRPDDGTRVEAYLRNLSRRPVNAPGWLQESSLRQNELLRFYVARDSAMEVTPEPYGVQALWTMAIYAHVGTLSHPPRPKRLTIPAQGKQRLGSYRLSLRKPGEYTIWCTLCIPLLGEPVANAPENAILLRSKAVTIEAPGQSKNANQNGN